jgi:hypothetical protein
MVQESFLCLKKIQGNKKKKQFFNSTNFFFQKRSFEEKTVEPLASAEANVVRTRQVAEIEIQPQQVHSERLLFGRIMQSAGGQERKHFLCKNLFQCLDAFYICSDFFVTRCASR